MKIFDLGIINYSSALRLQEKAQAFVQAGGEDMLFLLEHTPTVSIGKNFGAENVPRNLSDIWNGHVEIVHSTRGGNITCHFPGQLVAYPVINLQKYGLGLRRYVYALEEAIIQTLAEFSVQGTRREGFPGVWTGAEKIASLGLAVSHHVTMHGMALNVDEDISLFNIISPCGLGVSATSVARVLAAQNKNHKTEPNNSSCFSAQAHPPDMHTAKKIFAQKFQQSIGAEKNAAEEILSVRELYSFL